MWIDSNNKQMNLNLYHFSFIHIQKHKGLLYFYKDIFLTVDCSNGAHWPLMLVFNMSAYIYN